MKKNVYEYLEVVNTKTGKRGYIEIGWHDERSHDEIIKDYGLDVENTYYRLTCEKPKGTENISETWRKITTWKQVVEACDCRLSSEYLASDDECSYNLHLRYSMVRSTIDKGYLSRVDGHWYTPTLEITTERQEGLGNPVGMVEAYGENYWVYPGTPTYLGAQLIGTSNSLTTPIFPLSYNQVAVTSPEKAEHISRWFARELFGEVYGDLDYEWEEAR